MTTFIAFLLYDGWFAFRLESMIGRGDMANAFQMAYDMLQVLAIMDLQQTSQVCPDG